MAMAHHSRILLIGIGNRLRGDDGAGYRLAETLLASPGCTAMPLQVLAVHQLTPELAASIATADAVLFADAWLQRTPDPPETGGDRGGPVLEPIPAPADADCSFHAEAPSRWSHQLSPAQLLTLSQVLYGHRPPAWQLLLPAWQLNHGDALSPIGMRAVAAALQLLRHWRPSDA